MRDLSFIDPASFDIVWQPYSLNFVPDARVVFREVGRIMRKGGLYHVMCANPFVSGLTEADWNGDGYPLRYAYTEGAEVIYDDSGNLQ